MKNRKNVVKLVLRVLLILEAVYRCRYVYTFGFNAYIIFGILQPLPLFFALLLLLCNKISGYTPYYDVYSRILFCAVMILFIILSGWADKKTLI